MVALSRCSTPICLFICAYFLSCKSVMSMPLTKTKTQCNSRNKNPCAIFPDLCSDGGGLCIVKGPCEYQCICPPDGRVGRDCTSDSNFTPGTIIDSLLVFPNDMFWDLNDAAKPDLVKSSAQTETIALPATKAGTIANIGPISKADAVMTLATSKPDMRVTERRSVLESSFPVTPTTRPTRAAKTTIGSGFLAQDIMPISEPAANQMLTTTNSHSNSVTKQRTISNETNESTQQVLSNFSNTEFSQDSANEDLLPLTPPTTDAYPVQSDFIITESQSKISDTATVRTSGSSTLESSVVSQEDSHSFNNSKPSSVSSDVLPANETFPTLFTETADNPLPSPKSVGNSQLSIIIQRIFHPVEIFKTVKRPVS